MTGTADLNADNNARTNIGTGTTTSTVNIGGGNNNVVIGNNNGFAVQTNGHIHVVGIAPTTDSCGTGAAVIAGSTHTAGQINTRTTGTSCVINVAATWANAPFCVVANITSVNNRLRVVTTTTALTVTNQNGTNSDDFSYICFGRQQQP